MKKMQPVGLQKNGSETWEKSEIFFVRLTFSLSDFRGKKFSTKVSKHFFVHKKNKLSVENLNKTPANSSEGNVALNFKKK